MDVDDDINVVTLDTSLYEVDEILDKNHLVKRGKLNTRSSGKSMAPQVGNQPKHSTPPEKRIFQKSLICCKIAQLGDMLL